MFLLPLIAPILNPSSTSGIGGNLGLELLESPPSSPNKNAAFSRLAPDVGRLDDFKKGEDDLGVDALGLELEDSSGSSIHAKLDCAMVDRVGSATGLADRCFSTVGSMVVVCSNSRGGIVAEGLGLDSALALVVSISLAGGAGGTALASGREVTSTFGIGGIGVLGRATCTGSTPSIEIFGFCNGLEVMISEGSVGRGIVESSR